MSALSVALAAAVTSTLLCGWAPFSLVGRGVVFAGSFASAFVLARWAARASTPARAFAKSVLGGAIQANVAGGLFVLLAMAVENWLGVATTEHRFHDAFAFMLVMAVVGSVVGVGVGILYGFIPAYVVASRDERSHATLDRVLAANGVWLVVVGLAHLALVSTVHGGDGSLLAASYVIPLALGITSLSVAIHRARTRRAFVARLMAGLEPRYRVVPVESVLVEDALPVDNEVERRQRRAAIVRVATEVREAHYRESAAAPEERRALALL